MSAIETFAAANRLKVTRDDCGDQVIAGSRGHFYFDGPALCLMALDMRNIEKSRWEALGGKLWLGDKSLNEKGKRMQDGKIVGVKSFKPAIKILGCRVKQEFSEERKDILRAQLESARSAEKRDFLALKSSEGTQDE